MVKFVSKMPREERVQVICNVYEGDKWNRMERFHLLCYDGRYGEAKDT